MKQALFFFISTFLCGPLAAQVDFDVMPNPYESTIEFDLSNTYDYTVCRARVKNTSGQVASLRWEIQVDEAPDEWRFSVCDQNTCYFTTNTTNVDAYDKIPNAPVFLLPGDTSRLELNIFPIGQAGSASVKVHLYDMGNPHSLLNSACYNVTIEGLSPVTEAEKSRLRIYPNPAIDYLTITKNTFVKQLWVSNILGKRVRTFDTAFGNKYDVSDLPDGIYLVSMVDANRKVVKTVRISKRSIRP